MVPVGRGNKVKRAAPCVGSRLGKVGVMPIKPIDGVLVVVLPVFLPGHREDELYGMPSDACGCGVCVGYQVVSLRVNTGKSLQHGWIWDSKVRAQHDARKLRKFMRNEKRRKGQ